jgi:hypothetical protein
MTVVCTDDEVNAMQDELRERPTELKLVSDKQTSAGYATYLFI